MIFNKVYHQIAVQFSSSNNLIGLKNGGNKNFDQVCIYQLGLDLKLRKRDDSYFADTDPVIIVNNALTVFLGEVVKNDWTI